jgi:hypothetical protein
MSSPAQAAPNRRLRFGLRWLLLLVTFSAIFLAYPASLVRQAMREAALLDKLAAHQPIVKHRPFDPPWMQNVVGVERWQTVRSLDFRGHGIPKDMHRLRLFQNLEELTIFDCDLQDEDVQRLGVLKKVQSLKLVRTAITDKSLPTIRQYPKLTYCDLSWTQTSPAGIQSLVDAKPTTRHSFRNFADYERAQAGMLQLTTPRSRELRDAKNRMRGPVRDLQVRLYVAGADGLVEHLDVPEDNGDEHLELYSNYSQVYSMSLQRTLITDEGLRHVARLPNLRRLALDGNDISDAGLSHLGGCPKLEMLSLNEAEVTFVGFGHLSKLPNLRHLYLTSHCRGFRDEAAKALIPSPRLEVLTLHSQNVTSDALPALAQIKTLKQLSLGGTLVSDRNLSELAKLTRLEHLNLQQTLVTEEGLAPLTALSKLKYLGLGSRYRSFDLPAKLRIERAFPKCNVHWDF